ncbi:MAG: adenosine kinase [Actinomycetota bacterium]|nr:adenosine kinase [Actinomycetota bacterium]MDP9019651.1 adenosine kinase [Actinomycetota bacterium]
MDARLDVVGIGNALVDVIAQVDDAFLAGYGLVKGSMALLDAGRALVLRDDMGPAVERSGGSAANTLAGVASLGGRGAFIGSVGDDRLGKVFADDIRSVGVEFHSGPTPGEAPTGCCLVAVTPDAERTMSTLLGAAAELGPDDVDEQVVADAAVTYLEGYLVEQNGAREAFYKAAAAAHRSGRKVALTLSDSLCVGRFRGEFLELVGGTVDLVFANEDELRLLYGTDDVDEALAEAERRCSLVALTRGARGSTVVAGGERHDVPAVTVPAVVDTTGAGDLYAAGFLHGLTRGCDAPTCGKLGAVAAAEVITHLGARPETPLDALVATLMQ